MQWEEPRRAGGQAGAGAGERGDPPMPILPSRYGRDRHKLATCWALSGSERCDRLPLTHALAQRCPLFWVRYLCWLSIMCPPSSLLQAAHSAARRFALRSTSAEGTLLPSLAAGVAVGAATFGVVLADDSVIHPVKQPWPHSGFLDAYDAARFASTHASPASDPCSLIPI